MVVLLSKLACFNDVRALCCILCNLDLIQLAGHDKVQLSGGQLAFVLVVGEHFADLLSLALVVCRQQQNSVLHILVLLYLNRDRSDL